MDLANASWIPQEVLLRLRDQEHRRITAANILLVTSDEHRTQRDNLNACLDKIHAMCVTAGKAPTEPTEQVLKRLEERRIRSTEERLAWKKRMSAAKKSRNVKRSHFFEN